MTLSMATWMRSARSGSSLTATMPRCARGMSRKAMVSGSPSVRPSATLMGSISPTRSATLVSAWPASRCNARCGAATRSADRRRTPPPGGSTGVIGEYGCSPSSAPSITGSTRRADWPTTAAGSCLASLAEQHDIVAGDQRAFQLRQHGVLEAENSRPRPHLQPGRSAGSPGSPL